MQEFIIRPLEIDDITIVCAIENKVNLSPWSQSMFTDGMRVGYDAWVIQTGKKIVGFAVFSIVLDESQVLNFAIAPDFQHKGLGSQLLAHMMLHVESLDVKKCFLDVRRSNLNAQRLYEKFGFKEVACRKNYYPNEKGWEDAIVMKKDLIGF